jgi:hypothetical protein
MNLEIIQRHKMMLFTTFQYHRTINCETCPSFTYTQGSTSLQRHKRNRENCHYDFRQDEGCIIVSCCSVNTGEPNVTDTGKEMKLSLCLNIKI